MIEPTEPQPPTTVGSQPKTADDVNTMVGFHLRSFISAKATISNDRDFFAATDLKAAPYYFTAQQEALIKSAVADLDTVLDGIDMTFINQLVGMW